jgi:hypothetical protein
VVEVEEIVRVVAAFDGDEPLIRPGAEDRSRVEYPVPGLLGALEVDVLTAGGERLRVCGQTPDEGDELVVVGRLGPEPVRVEPEPCLPVRERGGVLGDGAEGPAQMMDVEAGPDPGLLPTSAYQDVDDLVVQPSMEHCASRPDPRGRLRPADCQATQRTSPVCSSSGGAARRSWSTSACPVERSSDAQANPISSSGSSPSPRTGGGVIVVAIAVISVGS